MWDGGDGIVQRTKPNNMKKNVGVRDRSWIANISAGKRNLYMFEKEAGKYHLFNTKRDKPRCVVS